MENTFDLKKFLVENKLTSNSRLLKEEMSKEELQKKLFDIINSDKVQAILTKAVEKLTPDQKQSLLAKTQTLAEGSFDSFEKFKEFTEKGLEVVEKEGEINEENMLRIGVAALTQVTGMALRGLGITSIMSMGFLPGIVSAILDAFAGTDIIATASAAVGSGSAAAALSVVGGLVGGAIAYGLGYVVMLIGHIIDPSF